MSIASYDEGNEWIAKLEAEAMALTIDIMALEQKDLVSDYGLNALRFALQQTHNAIEEIGLELMMFEGGEFE
jgi:hypothetical protein